MTLVVVGLKASRRPIWSSGEILGYYEVKRGTLVSDVEPPQRHENNVLWYGYYPPRVSTTQVDSHIIVLQVSLFPVSKCLTTNESSPSQSERLFSLSTLDR